jgi:hypothetical protein
LIFCLYLVIICFVITKVLFVSSFEVKRELERVFVATEAAPPSDVVLSLVRETGTRLHYEQTVRLSRQVKEWTSHKARSASRRPPHFDPITCHHYIVRWVVKSLHRYIATSLQLDTVHRHVATSSHRYIATSLQCVVTSLHRHIASSLLQSSSWAADHCW